MPVPEYATVMTIRDGLIVHWKLYGASPKPSKPWGCRSKTLTPTPEP